MLLVFMEPLGLSLRLSLCFPHQIKLAGLSWNVQKLLWRGNGEARRKVYLPEGLFLEEIGPIFLFVSGRLPCLKPERWIFPRWEHAAKEWGLSLNRAVFPILPVMLQGSTAPKQHYLEAGGTGGGGDLDCADTERV